MAAAAAGSPAGRVPPGDVLEREQRVAMDERRRRLRDAVDRTAVRVEQDRRAGRRRCPGFDGAEERVDAGARERGGRRSPTSPRRSSGPRRLRAGSAGHPSSPPRGASRRGRAACGHRGSPVSHRPRRTARGATGAVRASRRTGRSSRCASRRSPSPRRRAARRARPARCGAQRCQASTTRAASDQDHTGAEGRHGAHRVRREREPGGDPEVPAAPAAAGPEQVGVPLGIALPDDPVRGHHREAPEVVAGEAELAAGEPDPSSQGEARDADRRARSGGNRRRPRPRAPGRCPSAARRRRSLPSLPPG